MRFQYDFEDVFHLKRCLSAAQQKSMSAKNEPQIIADFLWHLVNEFKRQSFRRSFNVNVGGVFVHAQPLVRCANFPNQKIASVEIGDLLLLRSEVRKGIISNQRALLLQAKKIDSLSAKPDNVNQHFLYSTWPSFEYVRSTSSLNGLKRRITGADLYDACRYLLIPNDIFPWREHLFLCRCCCFDCDYFHHHCRLHMRNMNRPEWLTASPSYPDLCNHRGFTDDLFSFIIGDTGKPFKSPKHPSNKNWDRVIEDLTNVTAMRASAFLRRASAGTAPFRGQGLMYMSCSSKQTLNYGVLSEVWMHESIENVFSGDGPPEVPGERFMDDDGEGGVSIVEFVVSAEG